MAASRTINLVMNQGEDFAYTTLIYANTFVTENLGLDTLDTANAQMRKSYYHANATATFAVNINHTAAETVSIYLAAANTAAISPGRYVYDLEYYDNDRPSKSPKAICL